MFNFKVKLWLLWFGAFICMLYAKLVERGNDVNINDETDPVTFIIQHSTFRLVWSIGMCLIIYVCYSGFGGFVNRILSWKYWQPLSRLTYSWYLLHYPLKTFGKALDRHPDYFSPFMCLVFALGIFLLTLIVSIPWTLAFEMPYLHLQRSLQGKRVTNQDEKKDTEKSSLKVTPTVENLSVPSPVFTIQ